MNPLRGIVQLRRVWVGLSIGKTQTKSALRRAPRGDNTSEDQSNLHQDVDTDTEIVCQFGVNARDACCQK